MCDNQNKTPLYDSLAVLANSGTARFHMPGNKGLPRDCLLDGAFKIDYTEIPQTGNLYLRDGIIHDAEMRVADYYNSGTCVFLTCGATQGIKSMLAAFCGAGGHVLLDRNCHKSAIDACALLDLSAEFITPDFLPEYGVSCDFSPDALENILSCNPDIRAFLLTSPTYYGANLNIAHVAHICHTHGVSLLVDSAHGSHLRACKVADCMMQGADCAVFSAHKTLGALTQGAYLIAQSREMDDSLRQSASLFGTSSPSYPVMASLDLSQKWLRTDDWAALCAQCASLRNNVERAQNLKIPNLGDPCRLTIFSRGAGFDGRELADFLCANSIEPEMSDANCAVCIATPADLGGNLRHLETVLLALPTCRKPLDTPAILPPTKAPKRAISIRNAVFGATTQKPLTASEGAICAQTIAPYPPGVAVIAPGEFIFKEYIEYLQQIGYNIYNTISVVYINRL